MMGRDLLDVGPWGAWQSWLLAEVEVQKIKKASPPSQQQPPQQQEAALPASTAAPAQPPSDSETAPTPPAGQSFTGQTAILTVHGALCWHVS